MAARRHPASVIQPALARRHPSMDWVEGLEMTDAARTEPNVGMALDDVQDAILIFMRAVEAIDSGRVKKGRDQVMSAIGLLFEAETKMQAMGDSK